MPVWLPGHWVTDPSAKGKNPFRPGSLHWAPQADFAGVCAVACFRYWRTSFSESPTACNALRKSVSVHRRLCAQFQASPPCRSVMRTHARAGTVVLLTMLDPFQAGILFLDMPSGCRKTLTRIRRFDRRRARSVSPRGNGKEFSSHRWQDFQHGAMRHSVAHRGRSIHYNQLQHQSMCRWTTSQIGCAPSA